MMGSNTLPVRCHPLLVHELRARMRGTKAIWMLLGYLAVLSIVLLIGVPTIVAPSNRPVDGGPEILGLLVEAQAVLIALLAPALTCGAFSIEREHQTYDLLALTRINALSAAVGKLGSSLAFLALCLAASLPFGIASAAFGAVALGDILQVYLLLLVEAAVLGSVGLFWSAAVRSTIGATILTYVSAAAACALTWMFGLLPLSSLGTAQPYSGPFDILSSLCPFTAGFAVFGVAPFFSGSIPFWIPGTVVGILVTGVLVSLAAARLSGFTQRQLPLASWFGTLLLTWLMLLLLGALRSRLTPDSDAPAVLGSCLFVLLAIAAPFALIPRDCRVPPEQLTRAILTRYRPVLLWVVLAVAAVGVASFPSVGSADLDWTEPTPALVVFLLTPAFLLAQTGLVLALARWTRSAAAAAIGGVLFAGALCLPPILLPETFSAVGVFSWPWLFPFSAAGFHPHGLTLPLPGSWRDGPFWLYTPLLYIGAAILFGLLSRLPRRTNR